MSWWPSIPRLVAWVVLLTLALVAIARLDLGPWGAERGASLASLLFLGWVVGPALAVWTFADLRQPRLLLLGLLVPPAGLVQAFHDTGALAGSDWLSEAAPRIVPWLASALERLHPLSFVALLGTVLFATRLPLDPARFQLRRRLLLTHGVIGGAAAVWVGLAPEQPELALGGPVLCALAAVAIGVALAAWRSEVGLGGSVAGLALAILLAGLAEVEGGRTPLGLLLGLFGAEPDTVEAWGALPAGSGRALVHLLPLLFLLLVGHEWVATLAYRTRHDALTQIYNKAYAEAIVNQTGMMNLGARFAVALLDIDHFKRVNDTHGHGAGDVVLHSVAQTIRTVVATRGVVCRTGGEEITVFFPGYGTDQASAICEEVRRAVEHTTVRTSSNEGRTQRLRVTVSVGVASNIDAEGQEARKKVREVVEAADRAVYAAKHQGRNRVVVADG